MTSVRSDQIRLWIQTAQESLQKTFGSNLETCLETLDANFWNSARSAMSKIVEVVQKQTEDKSSGRGSTRSAIHHLGLLGCADFDATDREVLDWKASFQVCCCCVCVAVVMMTVHRLRLLLFCATRLSSKSSCCRT